MTQPGGIDPDARTEVVEPGRGHVLNDERLAVLLQNRCTHG
jgi:hypothetical protein